MNMELMQSRDVVMRILILFIPTAVAFLIAVIYLFSRKRYEESNGLNGEDLNGSAMLFLPVCATSFMYSVMEVLLLFTNENVTAEKLLEVPVFFFVLISLLCAGSCIAKGIIGGRKLPYCTGAEKQNGISKALLYMAAAEIPGIIALVFCMMKVVLQVL